VEHAGSVEVSAASVVAAAQALAKINESGVWIDRQERVNLNDLFERMTTQELECYAKEGVLPEWFASIVGATPTDSQEDDRNG